MEMIKKNRYSENKILTPNEQELLSQKRVAVIGCGGLGGYAAEELARLGIGELVLCDGDSFVNSNLNRQLMCTEDNIGCSKAVETAKRLFDVNSEVKTIVKKEYFEEDNAIDILKDCHLVIDAVDDKKVKLFLEKMCRKLEIPLVHGAVSGWFGQVCTVLPGDETLKTVYGNNLESDDKEFNGNSAFTPAAIASIQVAEGLKVLTGQEDILRKKVLFVDLKHCDMQIMELSLGEKQE